jgi:hypothetical protein
LRHLSAVNEHPPRYLVAGSSQRCREENVVLLEHPDGATFRSLFRDPPAAIWPATLLAEIGNCRERHPTRHGALQRLIAKEG